jgi:polyisoprenoid-binding protein YceI
MIARILVASLVAIATASAQTPDGVKLVVGPESELSFEGTSTLHGFHCKTTKLQVSASVDPTYMEAKLSQMNRPLKSIEVVIPVKSLSCGNKGLEENMLKTLKADKFPEIRYQLSTYEIASAADNQVTLKSIGTLTVAGNQKQIEMIVKTERGTDGKAVAVGTQSILMTDFGIKPPVFMLGALKTGNKIVVSFKLNVAPRAVAAQ